MSPATCKVYTIHIYIYICRSPTFCILSVSIYFFPLTLRHMKKVTKLGVLDQHLMSNLPCSHRDNQHLQVLLQKYHLHASPGSCFDRNKLQLFNIMVYVSFKKVFLLISQCKEATSESFRHNFYRRKGEDGTAMGQSLLCLSLALQCC